MIETLKEAIRTLIEYGKKGGAVSGCSGSLETLKAGVMYRTSMV